LQLCDPVFGSRLAGLEWVLIGFTVDLEKQPRYRKDLIALFAQHENVHAIKPDKEDPAREAVKEARITIYLA
jgi:hypothetical protein